MKKCLVVDDSKVVRMVARKILQDLDFDIIEAVDGENALVECEENMPAAVLLDWRMPVMNGIDFLKKMRALPGGKDPVVIFCTTEDDDTHIQEAVNAGADECVMKPFDSEIIHAKFGNAGLI